MYEDGTLLSGSSNVTCERTDEGKYTISIQGGFQPTNDIPIVSMVHPLPGFVWGIVATNGTIEVGTYDDGGSADDRYFSFVVYRP